MRTVEPPGDTLVWKSARVIRVDGKPYGYAHLWGMSAETALAVVDLLLDRKQTERARGGLEGWGEIEGFLLDARGNSGGYDPNILTTFLAGAVERRRLLHDHARRKASGAARVRAPSGRAPRQLGHRVLRARPWP